MDSTEQAQSEPVTPPLVEAPADTSVLEHAKQFGPNAVKEEIPAHETPEEKIEREHHSAQQRREKESGKFAEGKVRHRAQSQKAGPEDVPRIQQLTARAKTAEDALAAANTELARLRSQHASPAVIAKAAEKVDQAEAKIGFADPEPDEADPKFAGDYGKYLRAAAAWEGRKAYYEAQHAERTKAEQAQQQAAERASLQSWASRVQAAHEKYPDFETVAFGPTIIKSGSAVDAWIMEHKSGPDVLYYLQGHRQELESLLAKSVLEQVEDLALLSQRLLSSSTVQAGTTGSAASRQSIVLPPRPPNPVRTEAQRASDRPAPLDGSLSLAEHAKAFGPKRR